jgi:hypothetical protein
MSHEPAPSHTTAPAPEDDEADFYLENGLVVFTAHFLRRRGYCCESGCRHCPYRDPDPESA